MGRDETDKHETFKVDVSPEMQMYVILQHLNYNLETAYAEFIDNSVQSFLEHEKRLIAEEPDSTPVLNISINISSKDNRITIRDDAFGIKRQDMQRALKLGVELNTIHSPDSLSVYGIGMKSSAIWFTNSWSIKSSAIGESEALNFTFDLPELLSTHTTKASVTTEIADPTEHYTKITLNNHIRPETLRHYTDHVVPFIKETFHKFRDRVLIEFRYDGEIIEPNRKKTVISKPPAMIFPPIDKESNITEMRLIEWCVDLDFLFQGRRITGFIMIRKTGGYNHPGIRLIRNNRVIKGVSVNNNIVAEIVGTANKFVAEKLYGELNLDSFPVDFMKTNFNQNLKGLYEELKRILQEDYSFNMIFQAENYRKKVVTSPENKALIAKIEEQGQVVPLLRKGEYTPLNNQIEEPVSVGDGNGNSSFYSGEMPTSESGLGDNSAVPSKDPETDNSNAEDNTGFPYEVKEENRIKFSENLNGYLNYLEGDKACHIYDSLCKLSLKQHSALMYIGAWSFLEMLTALVGRNTNASFDEFLGSKINEFTTDKKVKSELKKVVGDISTRGNCTKHSGMFMNYSAMDLKPSFTILEPFLIYLIEKYEEKKLVVV